MKSNGKADCESFRPRPGEEAALARQRKRRESNIPPPRFSIEMVTAPDGARQANVELDHPDKANAGEKLLCESLGVGEFTTASFLIETLSLVAEIQGGTLSEKVLNQSLAVVHELGPRDPAEAMLASQMAAIHSITMSMAGSVARGGVSPQERSANLQHLNKLSRTFAAQMEALKRYRSNGSQRVTVEHRHYHLSPGAQAVFGDVQASHGVGVPQKTEGQSHERTEPVRLPECASARLHRSERGASAAPRRRRARGFVDSTEVKQGRQRVRLTACTATGSMRPTR